MRGFRLAGVEGEAVVSAREAEQALKRALDDSELGVLVITDVVATEIRPLVDEVRMHGERPLIAEISGPDGPMKGRKTLRQFVQEAVGIRVGGEE